MSGCKMMQYGDEGRQSILRGINKLADAVASTLGPKGKNVVIDKVYRSPIMTKDGVTVANEIRLLDKFENMGAQMVKEAATKTAEQAGDGTTTATILARSIYVEGLKALAAGIDPSELKEGIDGAVARIIEKLMDMATPCETFGHTQNIATISANGDDHIGAIIAQAIEKTGKNGVITVQEGQSLFVELDIVEGMEFDRGYISPYFVNNPERMTVEFDNPYILVADKKISHLRDLVPLLEAVIKAGRPLLIVAEDVEGEALSTLIINNGRRAIAVCAVKAPALGDLRRPMLQDIATLTGAVVISDDLGITVENASLDHLGSCKKVVINKSTTTIIEGDATPEEIQTRVKQIEAEMDNTISEYQTERLHERIARLSGGIAVIRVGGATELEIKEKKDRVEDALHATKAAVEEGIIAGAGVPLYLLGKEERVYSSGDSSGYIAGEKIVLRAIQEPFLQILKNANLDANEIASQVKSLNDGWDLKEIGGYDARKQVLTPSLISDGIIDPVKVTRLTVLNAASIAQMLLTADCLITDIPDTDPNKNTPPILGGNK